MTGDSARDEQLDLTDPGTDSPADKVVESLRGRGGTASSAEVAEDLGIHTSTARFHLDRLVADGRVTMGHENRATRGRPRTLFTLEPDPTEGPRAYQMLAGVLVDHLAAQPDPIAQAVEAGARWGRQYTGVEVTRLLRQIGFSPSAEADGPISLRHCPFIDLVASHADVVCPLHRGVVEGAVGHPVALEPHPGAVCLLDLDPRG